MRTPQFFLKSYTAALIILLTKRILHITTSTLITPELSAISRAPDEAACNSKTVRAAFPAVGSNSCLSGQVDQRRTPNGLMLDEVGWHSSPIVHDHLQLQRNRENLEVWDGAMFLCGYPLTPSHFSEDEYYHTYRNGPQQLKHNRFEPHDVQSTNQETVSSGESSKRQKDRSNSSEDATPAPDFGEFFDWFLSDRSNVDSAAGTVERKRGDETDSNQMKYFAKNKEKSVDSQISEVTPVTHPRDTETNGKFTDEKGYDANAISSLPHSCSLQLSSVTLAEERSEKTSQTSQILHDGTERESSEATDSNKAKSFNTKEGLSICTQISELSNWEANFKPQKIDKSTGFSQENTLDSGWTPILADSHLPQPSSICKAEKKSDKYSQTSEVTGVGKSRRKNNNGRLKKIIKAKEESISSPMPALPDQKAGVETQNTNKAGIFSEDIGFKSDSTSGLADFCFPGPSSPPKLGEDGDVESLETAKGTERLSNTKTVESSITKSSSLSNQKSVSKHSKKKRRKALMRGKGIEIDGKTSLLKLGLSKTSNLLKEDTNLVGKAELDDSLNLNNQSTSSSQKRFSGVDYKPSDISVSNEENKVMNSDDGSQNQFEQNKEAPQDLPGKMNIDDSHHKEYNPIESKEHVSLSLIPKGEEMSKTGEEKISDEKVEVGIDSPKPTLKSSENFTKSEEKFNLDLFKPKQYMRESNMVFKIQTRFRKDDFQERYLNFAYQKGKESLQLKNFNGPSVSMMSSLQIKPDYIKKKIDLIYTNDYFILKPSVRRPHKKPLSAFYQSDIDLFFQHWGKENFLSWEKNGLEIALMGRLALVLNLKNKEKHFGICISDPIFGINSHFTFLEKWELSKIIESVYAIIGKEEGTRRLEALAKYLDHHCISSRWEIEKRSLCDSGYRNSFQASHFEDFYGISVNPQSIIDIPIQKQSILNKLRGIIGKFDSALELTMIYGDHGARNKLEIMRYAYDHFDENQWWKSYGVEEASTKFGIDILKILKVGEALQFGYNDFVFSDPKRALPEEAYNTILEIITESKGLPWIESSERFWLYKLPNRLYAKRLTELSLGIFAKRISSQPDSKLTSGCELIWANLGLNIIQMPHIADLEDTAKLEKYLKTYRKISGPFADYSRMAISMWFRIFFFSKNGYFYRKHI